jgi:polyisoprenoid-binding protein YceI
MTASTWSVDPAHTDVTFAAKHMMVTTVRGKFTGVEGSLMIDLDDPLASRGSVRVAAAGLNSGFEARDEHLRSADFFNAAEYPWITFTVSAVEARGRDAYRATGDLTIREVTRPATFDVEMLGMYSAMNGARRLGARATTKINREDWGLTWNVALESGGWLVSKDVRIEIDLAVEEAVQAATDPAEISTAA